MIYSTTTSRLLPLVASNIRVMTSFDAVKRRKERFLLSLGKLHQQCHVMFIYSTAGPFQLASFTNGVALHLPEGGSVRRRDEVAIGARLVNNGWIMVDDRVNKGNILVKNVILKAKEATRYVTF